jgi:Mor family transcriptional regulator
LTLGLYPLFVLPNSKTNYKLPYSLRLDINKQRSTKSLRSLAKQYGVSHETIRRTLRAMDHQTPKVEL